MFFILFAVDKTIQPNSIMLKKVIALLLISVIAHAQTVVKKDTGTINGAKYQILFPANWSKKLVVYAHGYEFMGSPKQSSNPRFDKSMAPFLERGYAVAASDYAHMGLAHEQGVNDTEALRSYFFKTYGEPDSTFIVGNSMGGGISIATIEHYADYYDGALPMCPLAGRIYLQTRKEFDMFATFNGLFPGIAPSLHTIFDPKEANKTVSMGEAFQKAGKMREAIIAKDSLLGVAFAHRFDMKFDDLAFALAFGEGVLRDVAKKAGGNPYDNTNTLYGRFPDNLLVNQRAERLAATVDQNVLFNRQEKTGDLHKPTLVLHTIYDQLIPADFAVVSYENMVQQQGNQAYYTVKYTNGQGHCNFTEAQTGRAFDELRQWVKTGKKATAGYLE